MGYPQDFDMGIKVICHQCGAKLHAFIRQINYSAFEMLIHPCNPCMDKSFMDGRFSVQGSEHY